jgi:hypothetical protein
MKKFGFILSFLFLFFLNTFAQKNLLYPSIVRQLYQENGNQFIWVGDNLNSHQLRAELLDNLAKQEKLKLISQSFHHEYLKTYSAQIESDSVTKWSFELRFADAAVALLKETWAGYKQSPWVGYDAVSSKYKEFENGFLVSVVKQINSVASFKLALQQVESTNEAYVQLKTFYLKKNRSANVDTSNKLLHSLNLLKWVQHFNLNKYIVINVSAAKLYYFEKGKLQIEMKAVVGKPKTPSPLFAAWCNQAILYPYWYVPSSILFGELLSKIKSNPSWLDANNMQVVDGTGKVLNHHALNWSAYHAGYFPFIVRQSTGCDNSLGVIKFNIETPYGVYLHDTNNKNAFKLESRFLSHGCIRLEKPIDLAQQLLSEVLDTSYLTSCFKDQTPHVKQFKEPIAVFAVYLPAYPVSQQAIKYYKDIYRLSSKAHKTK